MTVVTNRPECKRRNGVTIIREAELGGLVITQERMKVSGEEQSDDADFMQLIGCHVCRDASRGRGPAVGRAPRSGYIRERCSHLATLEKCLLFVDTYIHPVNVPSHRNCFVTQRGICWPPANTTPNHTCLVPNSLVIPFLVRVNIGLATSGENPGSLPPCGRCLRASAHLVF